ncbi:uncharacterized protein LACBIDRAFT_333601 [Laccaria bicolor S238N-H82]|uniref:Predicted protein n=1 Tax=Laccaria bicolor (strain S238N-H82 / ATCC MYA-4686) TaxID=486041 RepID=B0DWH0_LACBS|nr:uncharacterized protein LACBIDRAFT_333601 [Laccaria bicolor S238N-H82]EDR01088.1 predicted protein [Laccaria bicolor S238N-H82]|eukprot:XP_001888307.1 predicted protein [Laccaria bicolor S238N-H82]
MSTSRLCLLKHLHPFNKWWWSLICLNLEIPVALRHTGNALKLQEHYTCYLALLEAEKKFKKMQKDGTWLAGLRLPVSGEILNLFIGKSTWTKTFPHIAEYPEMVKWLSDEEDCMETEELFGVKLKAYHFAELLAWVQNGGSLVKPKKGAAKDASAATSSTSKKLSTSKKPAGSAKKVATSKSGTSKCKYSLNLFGLLGALVLCYYLDGLAGNLSFSNLCTCIYWF